jgi:DNA-binding transcriptional LysR family regulator
MNGAELAELATFLAVARHRNFRKAALERGVAPSAVSHALRSLEARLAVRLVNRTTRSVSLTEAGQRLFSALAPGFVQIGEALAGLDRYRDTAFGTVRLNVPQSIAPIIFEGVLAPLLRDNPGLKLDIVATDRLVDIVEEGFDAGIRFGERLSRDMIAVRIRSALRFAVVGAPALFAGRSMPLVPRDLAGFPCIRYRFPSGAIFDWQFAKGGEEVAVAVDGPLTLDDHELMIGAALQGCGLAYVWDRRALEHVAAGRLLRCLEDWCPVEAELFLYYPSRRHVTAGLRALIAALRA